MSSRDSRARRSSHGEPVKGRRHRKESRHRNSPSNHRSPLAHRADDRDQLPIPPPPDYPPPPLNRERRKRRRGSRSCSGSSSHSRHRRRDRRQRRDSDGYSPDASDDDGLKRRRPRETRRRRSTLKSRSSSHGGRRGNRDRRTGSRSLGSSLSSPSSTRERRSKKHRKRRRNAKKHRGGRSPSPPSVPRRPLPIADDVAPRAGVVSDDEEAARFRSEKKQHSTKLPGSTAKKRNGRSSSHDDTVGHFKGREGTIIADRYRIECEVGMGTFGRVVECLDLKRFARSGRRDRHGSTVAIKIVRNVKRYYESARIEADILDDVNRRGGRGVSHCAVMYDTFSFSGHYCMVFEKLGPSLYDFQKRQNHRPFPLVCVRDFAKQLLETLEFLHSFHLIHTDLKPENILLINGREVNYKGSCIPECTRIKVIDFGGATYDHEKKSSVVNTRQYRAPEVILGVGWSIPSDLWSIGCILAELFQGELLFATHDNVEHLALIEQVIGPFPRRMLKRAKNRDLVNEAFDSMGAHRMQRILPPESLAYVKRIGSLESLTRNADTWFLRLLRRILVTDPQERATARECLRKL